MSKRDRSMQRATHSDIFIVGSGLEPTLVDKGIRRQILGYNADIMTCRVWFEQRACGVAHTHPHSQVTFVEKGRFLFRVGNESRQLGPGDCVFIPPGVIHGAECLEAGILLDNFSPGRADFLEHAE